MPVWTGLLLGTATSGSHKLKPPTGAAPAGTADRTAALSISARHTLRARSSVRALVIDPHPPPHHPAAYPVAITPTRRRLQLPGDQVIAPARTAATHTLTTGLSGSRVSMRLRPRPTLQTRPESQPRRRNCGKV